MKKLISMILVLTMVACSVAMFASCSDKVIYLGVQSGTTGQTSSMIFLQKLLVLNT